MVKETINKTKSSNFAPDYDDYDNFFQEPAVMNVIQELEDVYCKKMKKKKPQKDKDIPSFSLGIFSSQESEETEKQTDNETREGLSVSLIADLTKSLKHPENDTENP